MVGCVAALSRFVSKLGERGMLLYKLLRKGDRFFLDLGGLGSSRPDQGISHDASDTSGT